MAECPGCGYKHYISPKPCTNMIINHDCKILFVRRGIEPNKGRFDLPGGFADMTDRTIEETCYRELREELGINEADVTPIIYEGSDTTSYTWMNSELSNLCFFFSANLLVDPSALQLDTNENSEIIWLLPSELDTIDYAWDIDKQMLARYAKRHKENN